MVVYYHAPGFQLGADFLKPLADLPREVFYLKARYE